MSDLIVYPPSSALIPDTYDIVLDGRQCVHAFCPLAFGAKNTEEFLKSLNMELKPECIHRMDSYRNVEETLQNVAKTPNKNKSLLFLIFWGYCKTNGAFILDNGQPLAFYKIWSIFCTGHWRNTPKLFFLNLINYAVKVERDGAFFKEFETPNEGDLLIVVKKHKGVEECISYMENLRKQFEEYGAKEDFSSVITTAQVTNDDEPRAILISTMLKKLFLIPSEYRGHHYSFHMINDDINQIIEKIYDKVPFLRTPFIKVDSAKEATGDVTEQQSESTKQRKSSLPDIHQPRKSLNTPQKKKPVWKF